jgi:phenylpyruvate tautomerase PptA (4-oxalocrotonate tautomerase family)
MPFVTLYLPKGCDDKSLEKSMKEITAAGADILENTLPRMVRVTVFESDPERVYEGGTHVDELHPVVLFRIGPGRSGKAKDEFMNQIAQILHTNLHCKKENVRAYVLDNEEGHHFCIGGKPKDFTKEVKK